MPITKTMKRKHQITQLLSQGSTSKLPRNNYSAPHRAVHFITHNMVALFIMLTATYSFAQETAYCIPNTGSVDGQGITNVTIGTINNTTTTEAGNYGNFSSQIVNVGQGTAQPFSISLFTYEGYSTKIWVDWNNNFTFEDSEQVYAIVSPYSTRATLTGTFTVPLTTTLGNHRLRVGIVPEWLGTATPCFTGDWGAFEDYTINVTPAPTCFSPTAITGVNINAGTINLSWTAPTQGTIPAGYEYAVTTTQAAPASGTTVTGTAVTGLTVTPNAVNYLHVRTNCGNGDYSQWTTLPFFNGACIPAPGDVDGQGITNVTIGTINNTTNREAGNYGNYAAQVVNIQQGVNQQFSVSLATFVPYNVKIWADWNDDLDFNDEGEQIYSGLSADAGSTTLYGIFTVPVTATLGNHQLRIGAVPGGGATPCITGGYGTYEDYTINVTTPPTCYSPDDVNGVATASGTANLSWSAPALGETPAGYEYAVTTSATPPATGTATTQTSVTGYTGLIDNTYYYLHVRSNCGNNDFSQWVVSYKFRYLQGDICSTAVDLASLTSPYSFSTEGAENNHAPTCGFGAAADVFYSIEVPNGYSLSIGLTASNYDFISSLFYGGCTQENRTVVFCTDTFSEVQSTIWENTTGSAQTLYWVQDGYETYSGTYTINWSLIPPVTCDKPTQVTATATSLTTANISWAVPNTGTPNGYEYAVTTNEIHPESGTYTTALSITGIAVTPNVNSYLHVRSVCSAEDGNSVWVTYPFFTGYCVPVNTASTEYYITGITTTGGQTNFSSASPDFSAYTDYTSQYTVTSYPGGSFSIQATAPNATDTYLYTVWIDWNNDYDFDDEGERIIDTALLRSPAAIGNITIPAGTPVGSYRMRIRNARNGAPIPACGEQGSGEAEDYTLNVTDAPSCYPPFGLSVTAVDTTTAELRWSPPLLGDAPTGYEYVFGPSATLPAGNGTTTTDFFIDDAAYNPAQPAYLFVRTNCGAGEYSTWETVSLLGTNTPELLANSVIVYKEANGINIKSGTVLMTGISIHDIQGRVLYSQADINNTHAEIAGLQLQQQVLIVEVTTVKGKVSKRIIF